MRIVKINKILFVKFYPIQDIPRYVRTDFGWAFFGSIPCKSSNIK